MHIVACHRFFSFHFRNRTAGRIDFDLTAAVLTAQEIVVIGFKAGPPDLGNIGDAFHTFETFGIFFIDLTDVAENLRRHRFIGIIANRLDFDRNAGQVVTLFFDFRDNILRQIIGQDRGHVRTLYLLNLIAQLVFRYVEDTG